MPLFLKERDTESRELMDAPHCDRISLHNTYRQFSTVNSLLSGWKKIYKSHIKPAAAERTQPLSLLDIGFGGGDIPVKIARWAEHDNLDISITAIDTDHRALDFIQHIDTPSSVEFRHCSSSDMIDTQRTFDIVISNHLVHHLTSSALDQLLSEAVQLSTHCVLFNDIERSDIGYALFNLLSRPLFYHSFITADGLTSIKRSYTLHEINRAVPAGWRARRLFPFRLLLHYYHG